MSLVDQGRSLRLANHQILFPSPAAGTSGRLHMVDRSRTIADLGTLTSPRFPITLRAKLVLCTALILVMACLLLGCMFIRQQVRSAAESSVQNGILLAQHLAQMGRSSIVAGDIPRLNQHIQEILAVNPVAYVAVITPGGELQAGFGKGAWQEQFAPQETAHRRFAATKFGRATSPCQHDE